MQVTMGFSYSNWPQNWAQQTRHCRCRQEGKEPHIDIACPFDHPVSLKEQERSNTKT